MVWLRQLVVLLVMLSVVARADAQALPAFTGAVNKAIGKTVEKTAQRRGFAANDPRIAATMNDMASAAATVAGTVTAAAVAGSAPVWLTVAAGLGAAAVVGGLVYGAYKLFFDDSSSQAGFVVKSSGEGSGAAPPASQITPVPVTATFSAYEAPQNSTLSQYTKVYTPPNFKVDSQLVPIVTTTAQYVKPVYAAGVWVSANNIDQAMKIFVDFYKSEGKEVNLQDYGPDGYDCGGDSGLRCVFAVRNYGASTWLPHSVEATLATNPYFAAPPVTLSGSVEQIVSGLSSTEMNKAADPETVALLANNLWQQAASQSNYQGLPYSASDPVTTADAAAARDANPSSWPSNADLISPVASGANQPVPIGEASSSPTNPTDPAPVGGTQNVNVVNTPNVRVDGPVDINWGDAPTVHEPSINGTPTAQQILSPILTLMPGLRTLVIPKPAMVCPTASFSVFDHAFVVDSHCEVVEAARPTLFSVMAFVWVALGAMIVLRA